MKTKLFSLLCTLMCAGNLFAYSFEVNGIYYNKLGGDSVEVTYKTTSYNSYSGSVTIPEVVTYSNTTYRVTTIGEFAFYYCSSLTSVTIPNSVTKIGSSAFSDCSGLTSITIPNSVTTIGDWAFAYCSGLTSVTIGNSVTEIGEYAFAVCSGLTSITIPNSVTTIGGSAFYNCKSLTSVTIPNSVTMIGNNAFEDCSGLTSITIPDSVTTIGSGAFYLVNNIVYSGAATGSPWGAKCVNGYVEGYLVYSDATKTRLCGCLSAATGAISILHSVTSVGSYAFYNCKSLTSVTIPNSVTTIGSNAFSRCSGLTSITCYATTPPTCGSSCFYDVDKSIPVYVPARSVDAYKNASSWKEFTNLIGISMISYTATGKLSETTSTDYSGLHTNAFNVVISSHTFSNGRGAITFNGEVTTIGDYAFSGCSGLTSVTIPNSVTTIGSNAFSRCSGLTSVTIGNSVTTIGDYAFFGCSGLTSVTIPNSVTTIGEEAFYGCSGLTKTNYMGNIADWCKIKFGSDANPMYYSHNFFINDVEVKDLVIPEGVESIGDYAFCGCSSLTSVTIPNSVTMIGLEAFFGCSGLTSIDVDATNTHYASIDGVLFNYAKDTLIQYPIGNSRTEYTIPNSVTTIGEIAFAFCSGLTSITIPNSVTTIGNNAFYNCSGLTSVTIGNSVTTIEIGAFYECSGLTSVTIGNSVTTIGSYAFYGCSGLTSVTIPNSVTTIGEGAFGYCSGLTSVTIGNSVTTIEIGAFYECSGLTSITCYATNPPTCGSDCFYDVDKSIPVYVPARSVDVYKNAYTWKSFTNLQANPDDLAIVTCNVINGMQTGAGIYIKGDTCTLTIIPDTNYQFVQWNDGNTDNPRSFVVTQDTTFTAQIDTIRSGACGDDLTWKYGDGILVISGTGAMYDYTQDTAPWMLFFKESISSLVINNGCTSIGNFAFYGLSNKNLKTIDVPNGVEQIGQFAFANCEYVKNVYLGLSLEKISANAFANDERLLYITCFAIEPPLLDESAFVNYDAYLSVPCVAQADYKVAKGWKLFNKENVSCIGAEEKPITGDEVTVTPSTDNATIVWPANDAAAEYTLEITKDGVVFCTLTFNAQGQLIGIAFAPNRDGELRTMSNAEMTATGWSFTVTGLNPGSTYSYTVDVVDAQKQSIRQYTGSFTTTGGVVTSLPTLMSTSTSGKVLYNGHLYILRDGNLFTATGARVK